MAGLTVDLIPMLRDNYGFILRAGAETAVVDPAEAAPVLAALEKTGTRLTHILCTHHHPDHVGGNLRLKEATGCTIIGPAPDRARIPGIDIAVDEGETVRLGDAPAKVMFVPGHTRGHIAYWFAEDGALFCGDTLFAMGCGRMFEGTAEQMWESLSRLRALPPQTRIYCAHEYTQSNARFALTVDGGNADLQARALRVDEARAAGRFTIPSTIAEERRTNPFLRADDPALARAVGLDGEAPVAVFAEIRRRKDVF